MVDHHPTTFTTLAHSFILAHTTVYLLLQHLTKLGCVRGKFHAPLTYTHTCTSLTPCSSIKPRSIDRSLADP